MKTSIKHTKNQGQILLEIVVATGVFIILIHAIFSTLTVIFETLGYSYTRISARHIAAEKMEVINNLAYTDIGTTKGIPLGIIPEYETINRNSIDYQIHTTIIYVDDPFDNTVPSDLLPTDYKRIRIEISWKGQYDSFKAPVVVVGDIAPKGIETSNGGGTLSIFVIDALAQPVPQVQVHIENTAVNPNIDITIQTNQSGRIFLPGAPTCATCYKVTVTKDGYTSDKTYSQSEVPNPNKNLVTITKDLLSEVTFIIDKKSTAQIITKKGRDQNFALLPNTTFRLTGSKTIGTDAQGDSIFKYDKTLVSDVKGTYTLTDLEWDTYVITIPQIDNLLISGINPLLPISVSPNANMEIQVALTTPTVNTVLLNLVDASQSAVASASATLMKSPNFVATVSAGLTKDADFGQVFFKSLNIGTYNYLIRHPNFKDTTGTLSVDGNEVNTVLLQQ